MIRGGVAGGVGLSVRMVGSEEVQASGHPGLGSEGPETPEVVAWVLETWAGEEEGAGSGAEGEGVGGVRGALARWLRPSEVSKLDALVRSAREAGETDADEAVGRALGASLGQDPLLSLRLRGFRAELRVSEMMEEGVSAQGRTEEGVSAEAMKGAAGVCGLGRMDAVYYSLEEDAEVWARSGLGPRVDLLVARRRAREERQEALGRVLAEGAAYLSQGAVSSSWGAGVGRGDGRGGLSVNGSPARKEGARGEGSVVVGGGGGGAGKAMGAQGWGAHVPLYAEWPTARTDKMRGLFERMQTALDRIVRHDMAVPFLSKVKLVEAPNYYQVIKEPMDFGHMQRKLKAGRYLTRQRFAHDIKKIVDNCGRYNQPKSLLVKYANECAKHAAQVLDEVLPERAPGDVTDDCSEYFWTVSPVELVLPGEVEGGDDGGAYAARWPRDCAEEEGAYRAAVAEMEAKDAREAVEDAEELDRLVSEASRDMRDKGEGEEDAPQVLRDWRHASLHLRLSQMASLRLQSERGQFEGWQAVVRTPEGMQEYLLRERQFREEGVEFFPELTCLASCVPETRVASEVGQREGLRSVEEDTAGEPTTPSSDAVERVCGLAGFNAVEPEAADLLADVCVNHFVKRVAGRAKALLEASRSDVLRSWPTARFPRPPDPLRAPRFLGEGDAILLSLAQERLSTDFTASRLAVTDGLESPASARPVTRPRGGQGGGTPSRPNAKRKRKPTPVAGSASEPLLCPALVVGARDTLAQLAGYLAEVDTLREANRAWEEPPISEREDLAVDMVH